MTITGISIVQLVRGEKLRRKRGKKLVKSKGSRHILLLYKTDTSEWSTS